MIFREFIKHTFQFLLEAVPHIVKFVLCQRMDAQTIIWSQPPLSIMCDILSLTNSTLLAAGMYLLCAKNLYLSHSSSSTFHKGVYFPAGMVLLPSHLTSCTPTKSNIYAASPLETAIKEPALHILRNSGFQIPYPYSAARIINPKNPSKSEDLLIVLYQALLR
jgi:hypothetical protein